MKSLHNGHVVDENVTAMSGARNLLSHSLVHDFRGEILRPADSAEFVTALQSRHRVDGHGNQTDVAQHFPASRTCGQTSRKNDAWFSSFDH